MTPLLNIIEEKNIPFVLLTGDQPVHTLIAQLRNENKETFYKIIPIIGPFHTQVVFITAIAKRFQGSGPSDTFVSASIINQSTKPCVENILGRLYMLFNLQTKLCNEGSFQGIKCPKYLHDKIDELRTQNADMLKIYSSIKQEPIFLDFLEKCYASIGSRPMAEYWFSFMYMVEILMMNIHLIKLRNWEHFKDFLRLMIPWLQIYDKIDNGKWLPNFRADISNLSEEIDQYIRSIFAHSITGKPYSSLPTDLWIEMTMNKRSTIKAGWQRILGNEAMLCANIKSTNYINQLRVKLHYIADMKSYKSGHKENTASRIKLDELGVQDIDACIVDFNCDPFDPENVQLRSLQSGQLVSKEVEDDLLSAYEDGETKVKEF